MNKHTPRPWAMEQPFDNEGWEYGTGIWITHGDNSIASVRYGCEEAMEDGDIHANATLMAAAPELLDELDNLLKFIENDEAIPDEDYARACKVAAKAVGS